MKRHESSQSIGPDTQINNGTKIDHSIYNSGQKSSFRRLQDLLERQGLVYTLRKSFFRYGLRIIKPLVSSKSFRYRDTQLKYENSSYNDSFANERTVEVPIALSFLSSNRGRTLEIGNVLSHYSSKFDHDIVDKYEVEPKVINQDILIFNAEKAYDAIVSISTIEHIGFDESIRDRTKVLRVLNHVINDLLAPNGRLLVSFPLGYNVELDSDLIAGKLPFSQITLLMRTGWRNQWAECPIPKIADFNYGRYLGADFIAIGLYAKPSVVQ